MTKIRLNHLKKDPALILHFFELVTKEYLDSWMTLSEFSNKYNITVSAIQYVLKVNNCKKDHKKWNNSKKLSAIQAIKNTKLIRYGDASYNNPTKSKQSRYEKYNGNYFSMEGSQNLANSLNSQQARQKQRATMLLRYNVDNIFKNKDYIRSKNLEKFGVSNPSQLDWVKQKRCDTNLKRYGVAYTFQSQITKDKTRKTCLEKYGTENYHTSTSYKDKCLKNRERKVKETNKIIMNFLNLWNKPRKPTVSDLTYFICNNYYNIDLCNTHKIIGDFRDKFAIKQSHLELMIEELLINEHILFYKHDRKVIKPKEIDFYLPKHNLAIEVNDLYTHNSSKYFYGKNLRDINYHKEKTLLCHKAGIQLIHIFEPQILNKLYLIKHVLRNLTSSRSHTPITAFKLCNYNDICSFINWNSLYPTERHNSDFYLACFSNNRLIAVATYQCNIDKLLVKNLVCKAGYKVLEMEIYQYLQNCYNLPIHKLKNLCLEAYDERYDITSLHCFYSKAHNDLSLYKLHEDDLIIGLSGTQITPLLV